MSKLHFLFFTLSLFVRNIIAFKALDSYKMDSGEFPYLENGRTDVTKILTRFYVSEDGTCKKFYYKGSGGNSNNFGTEHECQEHLAELTKWETLEGCKEGYISPGPCTGTEVTRYGFVASSNTCTSFQYKGCGGNSNRFLDQDDCVKACEVGDVNKAPNKYDCALPPKYPISDEVKIAIVKSQETTNTKCHYALVDKSETRGIFPSFSKCLTTCYGEDNLIEACKKVMPDQHTSGDGEVVVKFYYHSNDKTCLSFLTKEKNSGFDANSNYFNTEEECMSYCPVAEDKIKEMTFQITKDACNLATRPQASGSMTDLTKWYFDKTAVSPVCISMSHGGVGDLSGLFDTETECNKLCGNE